jgi:hypothetical protein
VQLLNSVVVAASVIFAIVVICDAAPLMVDVLGARVLPLSEKKAEISRH